MIGEYLIFLIGIFATFFTMWSTVPQIRKSMRTKKADDVSKWLIISLITGLSLWVVYGIVKEDIVITSANSIGVSLNVILLILKLKYNNCHNIQQSMKCKQKKDLILEYKVKGFFARATIHITVCV